jgi:hypothetical protein
VLKLQHTILVLYPIYSIYLTKVRKVRDSTYIKYVSTLSHGRYAPKMSETMQPRSPPKSGGSRHGPPGKLVQYTAMPATDGWDKMVVMIWRV